MKYLSYFIIVICIATNSFAKTLENKELVILSDSNLSSTVNELVRTYSTEYQTNVNVTYKPSSDIYLDIENNETKAHIFISENLYLVKKLIKQNMLLEEFNQSFAKDHLVLIAKADSQFHDKQITEDELKPLIENALQNSREVSIIGNKKSRLYSLTKDYLDKIFGKDVLDSKVNALATANLVISETVAKDGLGFTARSFAIKNSQIRILNIIDDKNFDLPIYYHASIIKNNDSQVGHKFLEFLKTKEADLILSKQGLK
jgi:molybdenum ABC transporter molybdate-binding protein